MKICSVVLQLLYTDGCVVKLTGTLFIVNTPHSKVRFKDTASSIAICTFDSPSKQSVSYVPYISTYLLATCQQQIVS